MRASRWAGVRSVWVAVAALTGIAAAAVDERPELVVQTGHTLFLSAVSFSPDGRLALTASGDDSAIIWDAATGEKVRSLVGHSNWLTSAAFSPDGQLVVTASDDKQVIIWTVANGKKLRTLEGTYASFHPDGGRVVTVLEKSAHVWDIATGRKLLTLGESTGEIRKAAFSPDGKQIVTSSGDDRAILWDAVTGQKLRTLAGHAKSVNSASFSPDGTRIVTASDDKTFIVWNAATGQKLRTLAGHTDSIDSASFSPDGNHVVTTGENTAIIWEATTGRKLRTLEGHDKYVKCASYSPDGKRVITGSGDLTAIIWDASTGQRLAIFDKHAQAVTTASFARDGNRVVTSSVDKTAVIWDLSACKKSNTFIGHTDFVLYASFSPDAKKIVTVAWNGQAILWDAVGGQGLGQVDGLKVGLGLDNRQPSFSPDGKWVALVADKNVAVVYDLVTGRKVGALVGHNGEINSVSFSPDGTRIVTSSADGSAVLWDSTSSLMLRVLAGHAKAVESASFSRDGTRVLTTSADDTTMVWDAATGRKLLTLDDDSEAKGGFRLRFTQRWASFSPDGKLVIAEARNEAAALWDAANGRKACILEGSRVGSERQVSFSPDSKRIALLASKIKSVIVRDTATGQTLNTLSGHTGTIMSVSFSLDGRYIITTSWDGTTRLWNAKTGRELVALISIDAGKGWLAVTPEGYYQGSIDAERFIRWRIEGGEGPRLVGPEQFRDTFYRPDLFPHLLDEGSVYQALARADAERGRPTRPTDIANELPPVVLVTSPENHAKVMQPPLRVKAVATSVGSHPVESLQLELNGQPEGRIQRVQEPKPGRVDVEWPAVQLRPGENTILVIAKAGGTTGPSDPVRVTYLSRDQVTVRLRILVIGVDKYKLAPDAGGYKELRHAAAGARKVGEAFARYGGGLYTEVVPPNVLLDQAATRDNILDALDRFSQEMAKDDVGVIFYAGHGDKSNDRLYLTTHDTDKTRLVRTSVSASQMRDLLAGTKGRVYLFLDACHSGAITQRSGTGDSLHEDLVRELRREATGTVIATACRGDEQANEDEELGGFFTHALVEGLSGKARSPNGAVYAKGLKVYVEDRVKELTRPLDARHQQRPYFDGSEELMDVPLVKP